MSQPFGLDDSPACPPSAASTNAAASQMKVYLIGGVIVLTLIAILGYVYRGTVASYVPRVTFEKDAEVMADVEAKNVTIRSLSSEIARQRQDYDAARDRAIAAIAVADSWQARSSELASRVAELERVARERPKITTGQQADDKLRELGYGELLKALGR